MSENLDKVRLCLPQTVFSQLFFATPQVRSFGKLKRQILPDNKNKYF